VKNRKKEKNQLKKLFRNLSRQNKQIQKIIKFQAPFISHKSIRFFFYSLSMNFSNNSPLPFPLRKYHILHFNHFESREIKIEPKIRENFLIHFLKTNFWIILRDFFRKFMKEISSQIVAKGMIWKVTKKKWNKFLHFFFASIEERLNLKN